MLVDRRLEPVALLLEPLLDLRRQLLLPLRDPLELLGELRLELLEVGCPVGEALVDAALDGGKRLAKPGRCVALALGDVAPSLLGDPPLRLRECRERLGARERKRPLEIRCPQLGLVRDHRVEPRLAALDRRVERA